MIASTLSTPTTSLQKIGLTKVSTIHYQLPPEELIQQTLSLNLGVLNDTGALCINTGKFTGRSPQDKFIVKDVITANTVFWNNFNHPIEAKYFEQLKEKLLTYLNNKNEIWVRDCSVCANENYQLNIRVINEDPSSNLFAYNMFIRPDEHALENFNPDWLIIQAPNFKANPLIDGTRQENFAIVSFTEKTIIIGGTGYTGEMKKGIFTILNYILPIEKNVLSMHCSANIGEANDVAIFFGLSGTGKTTLSADPNRKLIGDDEHGWNDESVFNFEGGCYAKLIDLSAEKEPEIYNAIQVGALVENVTFFDNSSTIDFTSKKITENTRVSYPLHFISNALLPSMGGLPQNIFFLTCDATGVLPPISKLNAGQAMYHFISGYTAKVAGTETGITEPKSTFSACFGAPFFPLHPAKYAEMLGNKMKEHEVNVWMINTGWSGGPYGIGNRIKLSHTRNMITAALNGSLENVDYEVHPVFGVMMPKQCPQVPITLLNPRYTWADRDAYDAAAKKLATDFINNFEHYKAEVNSEIKLAEPKI